MPCDHRCQRDDNARQPEVCNKHAIDRTHQGTRTERCEDRRAEETLRLFSIPFAWAIRRELMIGNLDRVDQYFGELVQIRGFKSAILAKPDGKIIVASDRKKLVQTFSSLYPGANLDSTEITLEKSGNGSFRAMIPMLGLNKHLGMVVLEYTPPT